MRRWCWKTRGKAKELAIVSDDRNSKDSLFEAVFKYGTTYNVEV